jgi:hypothetical protein
MAKQLTAEELRQQAVRALMTLRFLARVSREPFDYQQWRKGYFSKHDLDQLLLTKDLRSISDESYRECSLSRSRSRFPLRPSLYVGPRSYIGPGA